MGYGKVAPSQIAQKVFPPGEVTAPPPKPARPEVLAQDHSGDSPISVRGMDDVLVSLARCCHPIRGEQIVGYITRGKGISVHAAACPNVDRLLLDAGRRIEVDWAVAEGLSFTAKVLITSEDRRGMLAKVTQAIAALETNIKNIDAEVRGKLGSIEVVLDVSDVTHLERVMEALPQLDGVIRVERTSATAAHDTAERWLAPGQASVLIRRRSTPGTVSTPG
ncbi:MAG: ACT domain-containing protein [Acidobacteriota bacterium]